MSRRITTTSPSFDSILASITEQHEAIMARFDALLEAIQHHQQDLVTSILAEPSPVPLAHITFGASENTSGFTALYSAVMFGNLDAMRSLLAVGASLLGDIIICGMGPLTMLDSVRISLGNPDLPRDQKKGIKAAIRLLEQTADERGHDAETMQGRVKKSRDGWLTVTISNKYTDDVLDYGRARLASKRAAASPAALKKVFLLISKPVDPNAMLIAIEGEMGGAVNH